MFSLQITTTPVFIMDETGNISTAREGSLVYDNQSSFNFIEKDGLYAYSEFFEEGWSEKYYNDEDTHDPYDGLKLTMHSDEWCTTLSELIETIPSHPYYQILDLIEEYEVDKGIAPL